MQKVDSILIINALRMELEKIFRFIILLCQLVAMPMVPPILSFDVQLLEQEFANKYCDEAAMFCMLTMNEARKSV